MGRSKPAGSRRELRARQRRAGASQHPPEPERRERASRASRSTPPRRRETRTSPRRACVVRASRDPELAVDGLELRGARCLGERAAGLLAISAQRRRVGRDHDALLEAARRGNLDDGRRRCRARRWRRARRADARAPPPGSGRACPSLRAVGEEQHGGRRRLSRLRRRLARSSATPERELDASARSRRRSRCRRRAEARRARRVRPRGRSSAAAPGRAAVENETIADAVRLRDLARGTPARPPAPPRSGSAATSVAAIERDGRWRARPSPPRASRRARHVRPRDADDEQPRARRARAPAGRGGARRATRRRGSAAAPGSRSGPPPDAAGAAARTYETRRATGTTSSPRSASGQTKLIARRRRRKAARSRSQSRSVREHDVRDAGRARARRATRGALGRGGRGEALAQPARRSCRPAAGGRSRGRRATASPTSAELLLARVADLDREDVVAPGEAEQRPAPVARAAEVGDDDDERALPCRAVRRAGARRRARRRPRRPAAVRRRAARAAARAGPAAPASAAATRSDARRS